MNVAFIPVRGGSKSIPLKNIKLMCGKPLVYWTIAAACGCDAIDKVYVATDSKEIMQVIESIKEEMAQNSIFEKVEAIGRSRESALDTASTESAMIEFAQKYEFDNIVLIQATSPLLQAEDLNGGFGLYYQEETDGVISVVRQKRFNWNVDDEGNAEALNYDIYRRPRRQEFDGYYVENGAFYITSRERLLMTGNRISGKIKAYEMDESTFFEIDEPADWIIVEELLARKCKNENCRQKEKKIRMFLTDSDGCLTDGGMYYSETGDELKKFHAQDGMGFRLLRQNGILCGIVTGEKRELVKRRADKMKLDILQMGVDDKLAVVKAICAEYGVSLEEVAYVGDDINDIEVLKAVGFSASVPNAVPKVREMVDYVAERRGGDGAIREIIDYLMENRII